MSIFQSHPAEFTPLTILDSVGNRHGSYDSYDSVENFYGSGGIEGFCASTQENYEDIGFGRVSKMKGTARRKPRHKTVVKAKRVGDNRRSGGKQERNDDDVTQRRRDMRDSGRRRRDIYHSSSSGLGGFGYSSGLRYGYGYDYPPPLPYYFEPPLPPPLPPLPPPLEEPAVYIERETESPQQIVLELDDVEQKPFYTTPIFTLITFVVLVLFSYSILVR